MEQTDITLESSCQGQNGIVVTPEAMEKAVSELAGRVGLTEFRPEREVFGNELADIVNFGPSVSVGEDGVDHVNSFDIIY